MSKEKKLKLDNLSSTELENKETNQIVGGVYCPCYCECISINDRLATKTDERISLTIEPV